MAMKQITRTIAALWLSLGTAMAADAQWPLGKELGQNVLKPAEPSGGITVTGRFQMFCSPNVKGHTFMLDTDTGRVWILKKDNLSGDFSLQRVPVDQVDDQQGKAAAKDTSKVETNKIPGGK
jgi:hypothetical protein